MTILRNVGYNISQCQVEPEDQDEVFDAMKSFPSGHAQIACFTATFLIVSSVLYNTSHNQPSALLMTCLDLPPDPPQPKLLAAPEVLAAAGVGDHGRHLLHQPYYGQQAPRG